MKLIKYILFMLIIPAFVYAEGGSTYSRIGVGELYYSYSARRLGMGELGVAVYDRDFLGAINPASWTKLNMTRFEVALDFQDLRLQSNSANGYSALARFSGATLGFPVERDLGISVVGGIIPYSNINYSVAQNNITENSYTYNTKYHGSGNITKVFLGGSYNTPLDVTIGATLDYYIGKADYTSVIEFQTSGFTNSDYTKTYKYAGLGGSFGLISNDFAKLLGLESINNLRLGLSMNLVSSFNSDSNYVMTNIQGIDTLSTGKTTADLPMRVAAGLSFIYNNSYLVTLDYLYQPWSNYKFGNQATGNLRALQKLSAGVEYRNPDNRVTGFWERMILRGGIGYEKSQFQVLGNGIDQYSVYAGFSIPIEYENTLDFAFQYGIRGTTASNLVKENVFKANVTLSLGEYWFIRPQR